MTLTCFLYMPICWGRQENFPSERMTRMVSNCRLWIFLCVFMFFPSNFYVWYGLANIRFFIIKCTFLCHAWWMRIFAFKLKLLLGYVTQVIKPFNKMVKPFNKIIFRILHFLEYIHYYKYPYKYKCWSISIIVTFISAFIKAFNDTVNKTIMIDIIPRFTFNYQCLGEKITDYKCCSCLDH